MSDADSVKSNGDPPNKGCGRFLVYFKGHEELQKRLQLVKRATGTPMNTIVLRALEELLDTLEREIAGRKER